MHAANGTEVAPAVAPTPFPTTGTLRVGEHRLDIGALRVLSATGQERLTLKAVQLLLELAKHQGATVTREHLLDTVWRGTSPTPEVVTQGIKELRRVLGDSTETPRYIETVPKLGYRLIADAALETTIATNDTQAPQSAESADTPARRPLRSFALLAAGVLVFAAALLFVNAGPQAWQPWRSGDAWVADRLQRVTTTPLWEGAARISADGTQVAYLAKELAPPNGQANMHVKLRGLTGSRTVSMPVPDDSWDSRVLWMPGGTDLAVVRRSRDNCQILGMPALGGATRLLGACGNDRPPNFDWSPDGRYMIGSDFMDPAPDRPTLQRQPIGGGPIVALDYPHIEGVMDFAPMHSPDGHWIVFRRGMLPYSDLYLMQAEPPHELRRLTTLGSRLLGFDWTRDGRSIVFSSDHAGSPALYTVDVHNLQVEPLGISPAYMPSLARHADVGVYSIPDQKAQFAILPSDGSASARHVAASTTDDREAVISPDASRVAFVTRRSTRDQLWLQELGNDDAYALTDFAEGTPRFPAWRADGLAIGFVLRGNGPGSAWEIDVASRRQHRISPPDIDVHHLSYASDGRVFAVALREGQQGLFELRDERAELIERGVSLVRVGDAQTGVLVNYMDRLGVFRLGENGAPSVKIADTPNFRSEMPWALSGSRIFHVVDEFPTRRLRELNLANGAERIVGTIELGIGIRAVSADATGENLLVSVTQAEGSDIGSFRLRRRQAGEIES